MRYFYLILIILMKIGLITSITMLNHGETFNVYSYVYTLPKHYTIHGIWQQRFAPMQQSNVMDNSIFIHQIVINSIRLLLLDVIPLILLLVISVKVWKIHCFAPLVILSQTRNILHLETAKHY